MCVQDHRSLFSHNFSNHWLSLAKEATVMTAETSAKMPTFFLARAIAPSVQHDGLNFRVDRPENRELSRRLSW
jgi:hypothetical protein